MINKRRSVYDNDMFTMPSMSKRADWSEVIETFTSAMVMTVPMMVMVVMVVMVMEVALAQLS